MIKFSSHVLLESKRMLNRRNRVVFLILTGLVMIGVILGSTEYRKMENSSKEFQKKEIALQKMIRNYTHYSFLGIRYIMIPSPNGIFFSPPPMLSEVAAHVDSISTVKIHANCRGSALFNGAKKVLQRFSGVIFIFFSLFVFFLGFEPMRDREFLKSMGSSCSPLKVFGYVIFSRFIIIACAMLLLFLLAAAISVVQGIAFPVSVLSVFLLYLLLTLFLLLLFLVAGGVIGIMRSAPVAIALVILVWAGMNVLIPEILQAVIEVKAQKIISNHRTDLDKLNIVTEWKNEKK